MKPSRVALLAAALAGSCVALTSGPDARAGSPDKEPPAESQSEMPAKEVAETPLPEKEPPERQSTKQASSRDKTDAKVSTKPAAGATVAPSPVAAAVPPAALPSGADKSGVTSQAISLPSTSGSAQGMGESFSAQLSTGIATFSVPFALPSARGAAQPSLGLSYSSSAGFGAAGVGWDLPVPFIARQTDRGAPKYNDGSAWHPERDRFVFNGGQELVPICVVGHATLGCAGKLQASEELPAWATGWEYYRPRVEGSFLRFFWNGGSTWRVQSKTGVTMELGVALNETAITAGLERNPDAPAEIYRWHLVRQYDTHGDATPKNVVVYRYAQDSGRAYLTDIYDTTPKSNPTTTNVADFAHHTHLTWQTRPDPTFSFRPGWRIDQGWRLATAEVASKTFDGTGGFKRVRKYHLTYNDSFHVSLLEKVEVEGRCSGLEASAPDEGSAQACGKLPPMTFEYTHVKPQPGKLGFEDFVETQLSLGSSPKYSLDEALTDLFDVNSDALPDVVVTAPALFGGKHGLFVAGASGATTNPLGLGFNATTIAVDPTGLPPGTDENILKLSNTNVSAFDLDGDGRANLVHMPIAKKYEVLAPELVNGAWQWKGRSISTASSQDVKIDFTNESSKIRVFDVDSDGLVDVVVTTGTQMQTFFSLGRYPWQDGQFGKGTRTGPESATALNDPVTSCLPWSATPIQFSDPDVFLGDMNGDGITDIVRVRAGEIRYWPGRGNGFWGTGLRNNCPAGTFGQDRHIAMTSSPTFGVVGDGKLLLDDVNGDGLSDLVEVRFNAVDVYLNINGTSWTDRHILFNTPPKPAATDRVRLVDVDGSGTRDILWGDGYDYKYIDFSGGVRPWLLAKVQNGLGKTTTVEYSTSTAEMLAAEATPAKWTSRMPTVAHVVKRVTEQDGLGGAYQTEYTYADPGYDGQQREFRGFKRASAKKVGDVNSPTDLTDSSFLLGECLDETADAYDDCSLPQRWRDNPREALKGLPWLTERHDENGRYLQTESKRYVLRELYKGLDGRAVRHAHVAETGQTLYDTAQPTTANTETVANAVTREVGGASTGDTPIKVPTRATAGFAKTRSTFVVDPFGNRTLASALGCESGDACPSVDEKIEQFTVPALAPGDPTKWNWRTVRTYVKGADHGTTEWKDTRNTYDANGDLVYVHAQLSGSLGVDRATAGTIPTGLSADGLILIANKTYDEFGNVTFDSAPTGTGETERCRQVEYDALFADLATKEHIFRGGCGTDALSTAATFDRGLELSVEVKDWNAQPTTITYDQFGRLTSLIRPLPGGGAGSVDSVKLEYFLPPDLGKPYSAIRSLTQDGSDPTVATYLESVAFVDGMGRTRATLKEADKTAGDGGKWIAGGFVDFDAKGALRRKYLDVFFDADWQTFDLSTAPAAPYGRQRYDAFGRQHQTFDLDGTVTLQSVHHALSTDLFDAADFLPGPHQGTPATERRDGHGRTGSAIERFRENGSMVQRETKTRYLPTGEPEVIERIRVGTSDKVVRWMRYDTLGRMVLNVEPHTTSNFTANHLADGMVGPNGIKAWRYAYNDQGELRATSDARGCGSSFFYDGAGRLAGEDYAPCVAGQHEPYSAPNLPTKQGLEVVYLFDAAPSPAIIGLEPPSGFTTGFSLGRPIAVFDRGSAAWSSYDARGRPVSEAARVSRPSMTGALAGRYAPRWYYKSTSYDAADREVKASTGATVTDLLGLNNESAVQTSYTNRGAVGSVTSSYGSLVGHVHRSADGLIDSIEYGDEAKTATDFFYDNRRRLKTVQTYRGPPGIWSVSPPTIDPAPIPGALPSSQLLLQDEDFSYDAVNNPVEIRDWRIASEWPAGAKPVTRKLQYDDLNRVRRIDYQYAAGDDTWTPPFEAENSGTPSLQDPRRAKPSPHTSFAKRPLWQAFEYDWLGNTSKTDDDDGGFYDRSLGPITNDSANGKPYQLVAASNKAGTSSHKGELSAKYDAAGHLTRLAVERTGPCLPTTLGCNQIFEYQWDEVGRLSEAVRWDLPQETTPPADGIPTNAVLGARLRHAYDAGDQRVLKTAIDENDNQRHTVYVFNSLELRRAAYGFFGTADDADYELSTATEVPYLFANGVRLARVAWEELDVPHIGQAHLHVLFELGDHLGSTSVVLDKVTSELVERSTFQAYGATESDYRPARWGGFREDYRFTGKEEDGEVGLQYFGKRYYAPLLNRWVSADPLSVHGFGGDVNLYSYVSGQALKAVDPLGLQAQTTDALDTGYPAPPVTQSQEAAGGEVLISEVVITGDPPNRVQSEPAPRGTPRVGTPGVIERGDVTGAAKGWYNTAVVGSGELALWNTPGLNAWMLVTGARPLDPAKAPTGEAEHSGELIGTGIGLITPMGVGAESAGARGLAAGKGTIPGLSRHLAREGGPVSRLLRDVRGALFPKGVPRSFTSTDPLVGELATKIEAAHPGHVVGVNVPFYDTAGNLVTDADILLRNAVVQVKSGHGKGLLDQLLRTQGVTDLPVIGFGPRLRGSVVRGVEAAGGLVTRDEELLLLVVKP